MTYCVGMHLNKGLVMVSDSRTNAGVDHVATFRKMNVWSEPDERVIVLMTAGNLAITQAVVNLLHESQDVLGEDHDIMTAFAQDGGQIAQPQWNMLTRAPNFGFGAG